MSFRPCLPAETVAQLQNVISTGGRNPILDSFQTSLNMPHRWCFALKMMNPLYLIKPAAERRHIRCAGHVVKLKGASNKDKS